jgi:hypothetical protein
LEALKAADVSERMRQAAETIYQALIEAELTAVIGAARHERTAARTGHRNGYRPRVLATAAGGSGVADSEVCARGRSSRRCWSGAGGWTRRCSRW